MAIGVFCVVENTRGTPLHIRSSESATYLLRTLRLKSFVISLQKGKWNERMSGKHEMRAPYVPEQ